MVHMVLTALLTQVLEMAAHEVTILHDMGKKKLVLEDAADTIHIEFGMRVVLLDTDHSLEFWQEMDELAVREVVSLSRADFVVNGLEGGVVTQTGY